MSIRFIWLLSLSLFCSLSSAEPIIWLKPNMPPYTIQDGPEKDQGRIDLVAKMLQEEMSEYSHVEKVASFSRILQDLAVKPDICSAALFKSAEREKFIEFSVPYMLGLSNRLVVHATTSAQLQPYLNEQGQVDLDKLLQSNNFTLGVAKDRKYGAVLDSIIKRFSQSNAIYSRSGIDQLKGLLIMSLKGNRQISGFLSNPDQVMYLLSQQNITEHDFVFYELKDNPPYLLGYMGCVKNDFGKAVIAKANDLLLKTRHNVIADLNEKWLDQGSLEKYRAWVKQEFAPQAPSK